jgi:hypothetical protein
MKKILAESIEPALPDSHEAALGLFVFIRIYSRFISISLRIEGAFTSKIPRMRV